VAEPGDVSVVIPAFNEEEGIAAVVAEVRARPWREVLVVDDGSTDRTAERAAAAGARVVRHPYNKGNGAAVKTGVREAKGAVVLLMDGDGQHDPADLPRLLAAWRAHPGRLVIGSRLHGRAAFPPSRWFGNRFACFWISWAAGHTIADSQTGLRVYPRSVMTLALDGGAPSDRFTFESEILIEAAAHGHETLAVPVAGRYPEGARRSHYRGVVDTARIVAMVAGRLVRRGLYLQGLWRSLRRGSLPRTARDTK